MRFLAILICACLVSTVRLGGQTEGEDPYSITFVRNNLQTVTSMPGLRLGSVTKNLQRLGDGVSIALLKILDEKGFTNTKTVTASLQLIHDSFSYPPIIALGVNKKPKVTMFFLNYLQHSVSDPQTQRDIQEAIEYVKNQTEPPNVQ